MKKQQNPSNSDDLKPVSHILTREERDALKPDEVLTRLMKGNERFVSGWLTTRDHNRQVREAANGQYPMAVVLSCLDSRIPVEDVFDQGIGDIFVARVAGNFENTDILGSMEFACLSNEAGGAGSKLVYVLGHESCGAVGHAIDNTKAGNITSMLKKIRLAVDHTEYDGERTRSNSEFVNLVAVNNVKMTIERIRESSQILSDMEKSGKIKIVGGLYQMKTGKVRPF